jgi:hypothetical protein
MQKQVGLSFCFFVATVLAGCAETQPLSRPVYSDHGMLVQLETPRTASTDHAALNSHPSDLAEQDLLTILRSVTVQKEIDFLHYYVLRQDAKSEWAFLDDDAASLVPHLKAALAKARPEELVVFSLSRLKDRGIAEITSGGLFIQGERVGLLLASLRVPVTTERKLKRVRESPLVPLEQPNFSFIAGPHQTLGVAKDSSSSLSTSARNGLLIEHRALLRAARQSVEISTMPGSFPSTLEEKLRQLKTWRDEGLITEPEYKSKLKQLLDTF